MNLKKISDADRDSEYASIKMPICVDFDGTIVFDRYPSIGEAVPGAIETLKKWNEMGAGIVLSTMRCGQHLESAVQFINSQGLELYGVQEDPTQKDWTSSPKCNGIFCVDDRNIGCPIISIGEDRVVDWETIDKEYTEEVANRIKDYNFKSWLKKVDEG